MSRDLVLLLMKFMRCVVVLACTLLAPIANANPVFHSGLCQLEEATEATADGIVTKFDVCLNGRAGGQFSYVSGNSKENFVTSYAEGTSSLHVTEYFALFAEGHGQRRLYFDDTPTKKIESDSKMMALRIGNAALQGYSLVAGKFRAPFGIGIVEASRSYRYYADEFHWTTYDYGTWLTWDDLKNVFLDVALVSASASTDRSENTTKEAPDWGGSIRLGYDFSAIEGSRLVGSLYGQKSGLRRTGVGFINVNSRGDTNWIEFVRTRLSPDGKEEPFRQIIKFGYQSSWRNSSRWTVNIEEDRRLQRLGEFAHHILVYEHVEFNLGIMMRRALAAPFSDRWHATSGIEVFL